MKTDEIQAAVASSAAGSPIQQGLGSFGSLWKTAALRPWLRSDFSTLPVAAAGLLLVAAVLKSEQLWATSPHPFASPTFALIALEFALWLALACFSTFALVALGQLLEGEADCGCFGNIALPSAAAMLIDFTALTALLPFRPIRQRMPCARRPFAAIVLLMALPIVGQHWSARDTRLEVAPGSRMSADVALADPGQWTPGTRFSLLQASRATKT